MTRYLFAAACVLVGGCSDHSLQPVNLPEQMLEAGVLHPDEDAGAERDACAVPDAAAATSADAGASVCKP